MLQDRIAEWLDLADRRNLAVENPITITVENSGNKYMICISHKEPNHVTLPFNVTWIVANPTSLNYGHALRRVSSLPAGGRRNTWVRLQTEQDLWDELQFWDVSASFRLGEVEISATGNATNLVRGFFKLETAPEPGTEDDPEVVGSNDPRMSDARQPTPHSHPLLPAIELAGSTGINAFSVIINTGPVPVAGQILAITSIDEIDGETVAYGSFVDPTWDMVDYNGPAFIDLEITSSVGNTVNEGNPVVFTANAIFDVGPSQGNVPALWSIIAGQSAGTINASTGLFTPNDVVGDQLVRVRAEWTHTASATTLNKTFDLTVVDTTVTALLLSLEIQGINNINEGGNTTPYVVVATYDDNTSRAIVPTTFTNSNSGAGSLNASTGIFTSAPNITSNQTTTLSATYTENGVTVSDTHTITVIDTTVYPQSATIVGAASVAENTSTIYALQVLFTDGSTSQVAVSNWTSSNPAAGTIDPVTGEFVAPTNLNAAETTILSATFTQNGVTVTGTRSIQALDTTVYPTSATIEGANSVDEGDSSTYQLRVTFSDNSSQIVPVSNWTSDNPSAAVIGINTGVLTAGQVGVNTVVNISASYTAGGTTVGDTHVINIIDTTLYPISLLLLGNATMNENTTQTLTARVTYSDNSTAIVPASYVSSNAAAATVGANSGIVTAAVNLQASATTTITGSYTEEGVTVTATFGITVADSTIYPVSATILGLASISEGTTTSYQLRVTFQNNSNQIVAVNDWAIDNPAAGVLTSGGSLTTPANVTGNVSATITASYTLDGVTVVGTLPITVSDETVYPVSATIIGLSSVTENTTQTYVLRVDFSNATNTNVVVSNWTSSATGVGTIGSSTGLFTALEQVGSNGTTTISASYTSEGVTVSDDLVITVVDATNYPVSAVIVGPTSIDENTTETFVFRVTFTDTNTSDVAITNWASSNSSAGVINATSGVFNAVVNTPSDLSTTISGSYTADGVTVSATLPITVVDTTNYPVSATIVGAASVDENASVTYQLNVVFTDTTNSNVAVSNWASSNPAAGTIDPVTGEFVAATNTTGSNISTTITASYTAHGTTVSGTRTITVRDITVYPTSALIQGVTTIAEGAASTTYQLRVNFSDSTNAILPSTNWASTNASAGTIDAATGLFTPSNNILTNQVTTISASYSAEGRTVSDTHPLTVTNAINRPVSGEVNGPNSMLETSASSAFLFNVTFDNNSSQNVAATWSSSNPAAGTIDSASGVFTPANVTANQTTVITASYTAHGVTVTNTRNFQVTYVMLPTSATITGATTMAEGSSSQNYQFRVFFDNGTDDVYAVNTWAVSNTLAGTIGAASGSFTPAVNVTTNQTANITASFTQNGATVNATLPITVTNAINRPISAEILGVTTLVESNSTTFQLRVNYENGTNQLRSANSWTNSNAAAGSITSGGVFTAASVTANQATTISASYTENGFTVNDTHALTVTNAVSLARVRWGTAQFSDTDFTGGKTWPNQAGGTYETWTGVQQFITDELTTLATGNGPHNLLLSLPFEPNPIYGYFAHPAWMGTYRFTDNSTTFDGSWDGASWFDGSVGDLPGEYMGPMTVTYDDGNGPEPWKIYRTDFSGLNDIDFTATKLP
jgi:hypothetical protein